MDILSEYYATLEKLEVKYQEVKNTPSLRCNKLMCEILCDEIQDVVLAIKMMERNRSEKCGYRPRRATILDRPDFYLGT